jgi:hypothetical protein
MRLGTGNSCDTSGNVMYLSVPLSHKLNSTRCSTKGKYSGAGVQTGHRSILFKVTADEQKIGIPAVTSTVDLSKSRQQPGTTFTQFPRRFISRNRKKLLPIGDLYQFVAAIRKYCPIWGLEVRRVMGQAEFGPE